MKSNSGSITGNEKEAGACERPCILHMCIPKMTMAQARKLAREGYHIMHIEWFDTEKGYKGENLCQKYPDCSHVLLNRVFVWQAPNAVFAVIPGKREYNEE